MKRSFFSLLVVLLMVSCFPWQVRGQEAVASVWIYQDSLAAGWTEWLWDTLTVDYKIASPVYSGSQAMAVKPGRGWTAWNVTSKEGLDVTPYSYFTFAARGKATRSWWEVQFLDANGNSYSKNTFKFQPASAWKKYSIDLKQYEVSSLRIYGLRFWYVTSDPAASTLYLDEIGFGGTAPAPTAVPELPTQQINFTVDAGKPGANFSPELLGVAHGNWDHSWGKPFPGQVPGLDKIYKSAGVGLIRYAGGLWANSVGWERSPQKTPYTEWHPDKTRYYSGFQSKIVTANTYSFHYGTNEIDSLAALAQRSGAEIMIQVNVSQNDPYMWADMVRYANVEKGYHFKYWELGNELDLLCYQKKSGCLDAATYQSRLNAYAAAMKEVDPGIVIVGGVPSSAHDIVANNWVDTPNLSRYLFAGRDGGADALSYHWYTDCNATSYEDIFAWSWSGSNTAWKNSYARIWSQIAPARVEKEVIQPKGKPLAQGISELNDDACDMGRAPQNSNQITAVWYADVLGRLAYNGVDFVTWYEGYGNGSNSGYPSVAVDKDIPANVNEIYLRPVFNVLFMYGNFFGKQMLQVSQPKPDVASLWASIDPDDPGTVKLIAVNLSAAKTAITVTINGFSATGGYKYELTSPTPLDRSAASNGPNHPSTINGYKLLSTNIEGAKAAIPRRGALVTGNQVTETLQPYSVTAMILRSGPRVYLPVIAIRR